LPNWTALTEIETRRIHTKKSIVRVCHERRSDLHFMKKLETAAAAGNREFPMQVFDRKP